MGDNELWQAFLFEVTEQLEHLEKELIHAKSDDKEIINQLFRYFHTIKSSCAMFEFAAMEEIAHAAENILDQIRKGISKVDDGVIGVLLKSVDCLKEQLMEGNDTQKPPAKNKAILQLLLSNLVDDVQREELKYTDTENALGIDIIEMQEFADVTVSSLQKFFVAFSKNENDKAVKVLKKWVVACDALKFTQLSSEILQLVQMIETDSVRDTALSINICAQIMEQLKTLEELTDQGFNLENIYPHFDSLFSSHYVHVLQNLNRIFADCMIQLNDNDLVAEEDLDALCEVIDEVLKFYKIFGMVSSRDLLRYFNQVCRKSILGQHKLDINLFSIIYVVVQAHLHAIGNFKDQQEVDAQCAEHLKSFRGQLTQKGDDQFGRLQRLQELTTLLDIPADYLDYIDNSEIEAMEYCINVGKTTALILVDLEANREWSNRFVHWLNDTEIITSRTFFCERIVDGKPQEYTKTSFLLVSDASPDEIKLSLDKISGSDIYIESLIFKIDGKNDLSGSTIGINETSNMPVEDEITNIANSRSEKIDSNKSIRIGSDVIDRFVVQVGEMVLQRNMLSHAIHDKDIDVVLKKCKSILGSVHDGELRANQMDELRNAIGNLTELFDDLVNANNKLTQSVSLVQEEVMSLRVVPISIVFNRLPRIVRNINAEYDKDIQLLISGEQVRVDKSMVDVLMEPLVHLVRNCADHGIEAKAERLRMGKTASAKITVSAEQSGNMLYIKVSDNGAGLNYQKIRDKAIRQGIVQAAASIDENQLKQLIFAPGFSTSDKLTETSGRGVGMDAVKTSLSAIGGTIDVHTQQGVGTTFTLKVPISAAIQGVIVFQHQNETLTIPERNVVFGLSIPVSELQLVQGQAAFIYQGDIIPVYGVSDLLHWSSTAVKNLNKQEQEILIITDDTYHIGLAVDKVIGRQEIFVRDLHKDLMSLPGVGGASILGNGEVVLILDCEALMNIAKRNSQNLETLLKVS